MNNTRVAMYRVVYRYNGNIGDDYIQALSAQNAADMVREYMAPEGTEVVEVSKVINNWK